MQLVPFQRNHEFVQSREFAPVAFLRMLALEALQCLMLLVREGAFPSIHLTLTCCSKASCKLPVHQLRRNVVENLVFFFLFGVCPVGFAGFTVCPFAYTHRGVAGIWTCFFAYGILQAWFFLKVFAHQVVNSQSSSSWVFTWLLWHLSWHICDGTLEQCSDIHPIVLGKERVAQSSNVAWVMHAEDTDWHLCWILNPWTRHEPGFRFWICIDIYHECSQILYNLVVADCSPNPVCLKSGRPCQAFHNIPWMTSHTHTHTTFVLCLDSYCGTKLTLKESIFVYKTPTGEKWGT